MVANLLIQRQAGQGMIIGKKNLRARKIHVKGDTYMLAPRQTRVIICHDLGKELSLSIKGEEKKSQQNVKTYF